MTSNRPESSLSSPTTRSSIISESVSVTSTKISSGNLYNISYLLKRMRNERNPKHSLSLSEQQKSSKMTGWLPSNTIRQLSMHHGTITHKQKSLLNNDIPLIDTHHEQQTDIKTPIHKHKKTLQFHLDRLKKKEQKLNIHQLNKKLPTRQQKSYKTFFKSEKDENQKFDNAAYCVAYCTIIIIGVTIGGWSGGLFEFISGNHNGCYNEHEGNLICQLNYSSFNIITHCINIFYTHSILDNAPYICLCRLRNNSQGKYRDCKYLHVNI